MRSRRRIPRCAAGLVIVLAAALSACTEGTDPTIRADPNATTTSTAAAGTTTTMAPGAVDPLGGFVPAPIDWEGCGGGIECARVTVPRDWSNVSGETIGIAVARRPAADDGAPPGFLAYNLGGPGVEGVSSVGSEVLDAELSDQLDIVSWDPRGVGDSAPLSCGDAVDPFLDADPQPDDDAEQAALDAAAQALAAECGAEDAAMLPFLGTDDVARDLEAIRRAYGEPMTYIGFSYGTLIGLRYAELFPTGATRIVLDGVVDPELALTDVLRGQAIALEAAIEAVFAGCPPGTSRCPDGGAAAAYDRLAAAVEQRPIPSSEGPDVGPAELARAVILASYDESYWPSLHTGLAAAEDGDGAVLAALADAYETITEFTAYQAINCIDSANPAGADAWAAFAAELEAVAPRFGTAVANEMLPCAFWPVPSRPVTGPVRAEGSSPILVIGTTGDAATPLAQAERVAANLANGHLLVYEGEGHTAYGRVSCVDDIVHAFVLAGALPPAGARC